MVMNELYEQIKEEFLPTNKGLTDPIINKLAQFCEIFNLTPAELSYKWEAYIIEKPDSIISEELLDDFRISVLQRDIESGYKENQNGNPFKLQTSNTPKTLGINNGQVFDKNSLDNLDTIVSKMVNKRKKIIPINSNANSFITSPVRSSQNYYNRNFFSPNRSNGPFSPTRYGKIDKKDEISSMTQKFLDRPRKGELDVVLNKHLPKPTSTPEINQEVSIAILDTDQQIDSYRYMYSKLQDIGDIIDARIENFSDLIKSHNNIKEFSYPQLMLPDEFVTAGRILNDTLDILDADNTINNENSFVLEPCKRDGSGVRVKLNFAKLSSEGKAYTLFPGQILGIKGTNITGRRIDVNEILEMPSLPVPATSIAELSQYYAEDKKRPISIFVASGPYTCEDSLQYEPFQELFEKYIEPESPDVVILMGPFIDDRHPKLVNGDTEYLPEEIFAHYLSPKITQYYEKAPHSTIILIPSLNDVLSETVSFPQPPLDSPMITRNEQFKVYTDESLLAAKSEYIMEKRMALGLPVDTNRVICYPNPVQFQINDVIFAISNNDILSHLSNEEVYHPSSTFGSPSPFQSSPAGSESKPMDRISRLTRHLLQQRSLYPLFPPMIDEANINYEHEQGFQLRMKPDVLILNSAMRLFAKTVDNVVCVNPGQVVHKIEGTFSKFYIYPMDLPANAIPNKGKDKMEEDEDNDIKKEEIQEEGEMEVDQPTNSTNIIHEVSKRCRVEIQRV